MKDWDEKEKPKFQEKLIMKKGQMNQLLSDCLAFRFLRVIVRNEEAQKGYDELSKVCDDVIFKMGLPQTKADTDLICNEIMRNMKLKGWKC